MTMPKTPPKTVPSHLEHEMIPSEDHADWHYSHLFGLRTVISAMRLLNQPAQYLADEVIHHEEPFQACVAALKMLKADEMAALRRARFASRARDALTEAIAARNDPRTRALMQSEIDFDHVPELSKTVSFIANDIRVDPESGCATMV